MAKSRKHWSLSSAKQKNALLSEAEKKNISDSFTEIIETFKSTYIKENPNKIYNYLADVYPLWYRSFFYLCGKYKSESPNRIADEFEEKFVRLEYKGKDCFNISYFRHTGQWSLVAQSLSLQDCKEMILDIPTFHPF